LPALKVGIDYMEIKTEPFEKFINPDNMDSEGIEKLKRRLDNNEDFIFDYPMVIASKENNQYVVKSISINHQNVSFKLTEESDGTQRLIDFIPMFHGLLNKGYTYIIDEIDRSLHPTLLHSLIHKIMDDDATKGQLIFTTHESSLLDGEIFRTDEIWFAEKEVGGATQLYTLNEFKPRPDLNIEKGYLNGRFGAIPFLSKLEDLNWHE
jgi:AAA15 family ATPase/GTPase